MAGAGRHPRADIARNRRPLISTPGSVVAGRFELLSIAGSGGMGVVWRALDQMSGKIVALKLMRGDADGQLAWLEREARLLADLDHPSVPRYVGHGAVDAGACFLAMEWLDGEPLATRLERGPLDVETTLGLGCGLAEVLASLHARGIVHCDLKPSNLFLGGGDGAVVKLIDFGVARAADGVYSLVETGIVGTPFYMAPEQARGESTLDGRADLYSLGCILFECLTGRPPFVAANAVAVLAKAMFEEAPSPGELRAGIPAELDTIVGQLLEKDAAARPPDASAVARSLAALRGAAVAPPDSREPTSLTQNERRLTSIVLATEAASRAQDPARKPESTVALFARSALQLSALQEIGVKHEARLEALGDGSVAAVLVGSGAPMDLAANAARCALALRALLPEAQVALVTGWEVFTGSQPLGRVIDRAAALLDARAGASTHVLLDPMTAALLDERFALEGGDEVPTLACEREPLDEVRRLLGKPIVFLGRERELGILEDLFDACVAEPAARAVLITGVPGVGKSRLRGEFVHRIRASGQQLPVGGRSGEQRPVEIWIARGDPMRQKAPFGLLGQLVRRAARLVDGEPLDVRRQKLAARVARSTDPAIQRRIAEFLGEMVGTPFPGEDSPQLRAARLDPMLMGDQLRRAWLDFLEAECRAHPVLVVLEDLQWGDQPTMDLIDAALGVLEDRPLMALAVARPEITEAFPRLWSERGVTALRLGQLSRRACEQLVRRALGEQTSNEQVSRLVERSAQIPFMLEELVRAVDEGRGEEVPETVLAMMQSRLQALDPEARRLLRAGSLFGEVFWRGALAALLGSTSTVDELLPKLEQGEWIKRRRIAKFHGEAEYVFRHGLIRDAAYEMLTAGDRALGHRLAGEWLSQAGEMDAMALAAHFDRGGEPARALGHYRAAAKQALGGNDLSGAIERVERGMACGASGSDLGELCLVRAEAHRWQGSFADARQWAERALAVFPKGSDGWFSAIREALASLLDVHEQRRILEIAEMLDEAWSIEMDAGAARVIATAWMAIRLYALALHDRAEPFHRRLEQVEEQFASEPIAHACIAMESAFRQGYLPVDMSVCGETMRAAADRFERAGDLRGACQMRVNLGHVYNELGAYHENVELLTDLHTESQRLGLSYVAAAATSHRTKALLALGRLDEAKASATKAIAALSGHGDPRTEAVTRAYLAMILGRSGELERAETEASRAVEALQSVPALEPFALAVLASVRLAGGRTAEAVELSARAAALVALAEESEALIRLVHAEALHAAGDSDGARVAVTVAADRVLERARTIASAAWRRGFLENVAENARTLDLSRAWSAGRR